MTPESWAALTLALVIGAMSPGPSLALVLRNTMIGGRRLGILTGLGHGIGFGLYAVITSSALAAALSANNNISELLRWAGVGLLIWLGYNFIRRATKRKMPDAHLVERCEISGHVGFVQGFLLAILNPKILAWMLAIYAPFVRPAAPITTTLTMGLLATCTDATWYISVAALLYQTGAIRILRARAHLIDIAMGTFMLLLALLIAAGLV